MASEVKMSSESSFRRAVNFVITGGQVSASLTAMMAVAFLPVKTYLDVESIQKEQEKMQIEQTQMKADVVSIQRDVTAILAKVSERRRGWFS